MKTTALFHNQRRKTGDDVPRSTELGQLWLPEEQISPLLLMGLINHRRAGRGNRDRLEPSSLKAKSGISRAASRKRSRQKKDHV